VVADFIAAEHAAPDVHRYVLPGTPSAPIAAAALTIHDRVAVLGGAATLPEHRGRGAQTRLLHHRLAAAHALGATLAVATARPGSPSARNLARTGFTPHRRPVVRVGGGSW
jgi:GNAT superfamily N-acetyltransferase